MQYAQVTATNVCHPTLVVESWVGRSTATGLGPQWNLSVKQRTDGVIVQAGDASDVQVWISYIKALETDRDDQNYTPCRFAVGQQTNAKQLPFSAAVFSFSPLQTCGKLAPLPAADTDESVSIRGHATTFYHGMNLNLYLTIYTSFGHNNGTVMLLLIF